jgi:hypothetical protein
MDNMLMKFKAGAETLLRKLGVSFALFSNLSGQFWYVPTFLSYRVPFSLQGFQFYIFSPLSIQFLLQEPVPVPYVLFYYFTIIQKFETKVYCLLRGP